MPRDKRSTSTVRTPLTRTDHTEASTEGPAGAPGAGGGTASRVVLTGDTTTIADRQSLIVVDYFAVEGTGVLAIQGDGVLAVQ